MQEEVTLMNSRKEQIKERIKEIEMDFDKFKNEVREKQVESQQMLQDVEGVKSIFPKGNLFYIW